MQETTQPVTASATIETPFRRFARNFFSSKIATAGFALLVLILLAALFAPVLFATPTLPGTVEEYQAYRALVTRFVAARNDRINSLFG